MRVEIDADTIDEIIERLQEMSKEDLLCHAVYHTIATSIFFRVNKFEKADVDKFTDEVVSMIDKAFEKRKENFS